MYDKILVIDFEATCSDLGKPNPQEIIEFPCVMINVKNKTIEDIFHYYVKPFFHPHLSLFCTELTGITQSTVDKAHDFQMVYNLFLEWLKSHNLSSDNPSQKNNSFIFMSCGEWDFKTAIRKNCELYDIHLPHCFNNWINVKQAFYDLTGTKAGGMTNLLNKCNLKLKGKHHSGVDDSKNIARCAIHMLKNLKWIPKKTSCYIE
jgi:ERI1 exoribonuclease 3